MALASTPTQDSGLSSLTLLLRLYGSNSHVEQIRQRCRMARIGVPDMLGCAQQLGFKASITTPTWNGFINAGLPGIAALRDGGFLILGKVADNKVLILRPDAPRPEVITRAQFETIWDGRVVLIKRRSALSGVLSNSIFLLSGLRIGNLLRRTNDALVQCVSVMRPRTRALVHRVHTSFIRLASYAVAASLDPSVEVTRPVPATSEDSGLPALVLLRGTHGTGRDVAPFPPNSPPPHLPLNQ